MLFMTHLQEPPIQNAAVLMTHRENQGCPDDTSGGPDDTSGGPGVNCYNKCNVTVMVC